MQGITPKQERFAVEYVATGNASEAYRRAYDAENMLPGSIATEASLLLDNPKVSQMVEAEKERALGPVRASAEWVISSAAEIVERSLEAKPVYEGRGKERHLVEGEWQYDAMSAVAALNLLAKRLPEFREAGITIDNRSMQLSGLSLEELKSLAGK